MKNVTPMRNALESLAEAASALDQAEAYLKDLGKTCVMAEEGERVSYETVFPNYDREFYVERKHCMTAYDLCAAVVALRAAVEGLHE